MLTPLATGAYLGLGFATGLGLAVGGCAYAAMWPASRLFGSALIAPRLADGRPAELALTFDDGPNPAWTPELLDILASHRVRATFFLVGHYAWEEPALVRRILAAGHLIGNHSWSHPNLAITPAAEVQRQLKRTNDTLEEITGQPVRFFRPPFGGRRPVVLQIARELGMAPVLWNAITTDWSEPLHENIAKRLIAKIDRNQQRGFATNIVLHDGGHLELGANRGPSVAAARQLLLHYRPTHSFVTLDEWTQSTA